VSNPLQDVDLPYMLLRLRQGIGRLIRTHEDKGIITIFVPEKIENDLYENIMSVLPISTIKQIEFS